MISSTRYLLDPTFSAYKVKLELDLVKGTIFAFLTALDTMGNISVFVNYLLMFADKEKKSIHFILIHLAFTNVVTLLCKGMPKTIAAFGVRKFLDDTRCKIVVYLGRVARGLSICTSALLTVVQAATISPIHSRWRRLKPRSAWHIIPLLIFLWIPNSLIGMNLLYYIKSTSMNISQFSDSDSNCHFQPQNQKIRLLFLILMVVRDAVSQVLMGGASGSTVFLLHKHHQWVLHLQSCKLLYKTPPEIKAAQSVLLLMLCFLFFYWVECILSLFLHSFLENNLTIVNIWEFMTFGYASLSPFVLIHRDGSLREHSRAL